MPPLGLLAAGAAVLATTTPAAHAEVGGPDSITDSVLGTKVVVTYQSGSGDSRAWTLDCEASAGTHPNPKRACAVLDAHGERALKPTSPTAICTLQYGGPQTAQVTGSFRGKPVVALLSRANGCEIARWNALVGLLPEH